MGERGGGKIEEGKKGRVFSHFLFLFSTFSLNK